MLPGKKREKIMVLTEQGRAYSQSILTALYKLEDAVFQQMGEQLTEQLITSASAYGNLFEQEMLNHDL